MLIVHYMVEQLNEEKFKTLHRKSSYTIMSTDLTVEDIRIPVKRTDGETLKDRMSSNAWNNLMPARYIRQDVNDNNLESHEEVFERVAKNVALGDVIHILESEGITYEVTPQQIKENHAKRDEVAEEVFGE